ncbi:ABC transporter substrate-binding protein [Paenibacillus silvisoli]|uniref:ABC transporter substrate-binding protein n=1 Tax=Paenibacillus silvisoli TaxID=3110539 RepID=UPI00280540C8|nr:ABC transporter substrate-binding protein [Paenibacillus silvisoli]
MTWYFPLPAVPADMQSVEDAVNKITQAKINATIHMKPAAFGDYTQKMNVIVASGEESDIIWTSNWNFDYAQNVAKGAFIPLDDLLAKYAPDVQKSMPSFVWDATKVGGKTYGLPDYQTVTNREGFKIVKSFADKYSLDTSKIKKITDIEPFLAAVKKGEPGKIPFALDQRGVFGGMLHTFGLEGIGGLGTVNFSDPSKVTDMYETDAYKQYLNTMHDWYTKGYINEDAATVKNANDVIKTGNVVSVFHNVLSADAVANAKATLGDIVLAPTTDFFASTGTIITTMQAISKTSKNPERAMMFLNLVNTDKELYNILAYGVQGKHYTLGADNTVQVNADAGYAPNAAWVFGNTFNALLTPGKTADIVGQVEKDNESAQASPLMGFIFDVQPVSAEIASVTAVVNQYGPPLNTGTVDPAKTLPEFISQLKSAGIDKVIAEMQKQLDSWKAAK